LPDLKDSSTLSAYSEQAVAIQPRPNSSSDYNPDQFVQEVIRAKRELDIARAQFDIVADPMLVDHIVYRIGAAETHLNYLFKLARRLGVAVDGVHFEWVYPEDGGGRR